MGQIPELPQLADIGSAVAAWLAGELVKRVAAGRTWERSARRAIPVIVLAVGAGARVAIAGAVDGDDWRTAVLRGAIAGGAAVYAHQLRAATVGGNVRGASSSRADDDSSRGAA